MRTAQMESADKDTSRRDDRRRDSYRDRDRERDRERDRDRDRDRDRGRYQSRDQDRDSRVGRRDFADERVPDRDRHRGDSDRYRGDRDRLDRRERHDRSDRRSRSRERLDRRHSHRDSNSRRSSEVEPRSDDRSSSQGEICPASSQTGRHSSSSDIRRRDHRPEERHKEAVLEEGQISDPEPLLVQRKEQSSGDGAVKVEEGQSCDGVARPSVVDTSETSTVDQPLNGSGAIPTEAAMKEEAELPLAPGKAELSDGECQDD